MRVKTYDAIDEVSRDYEERGSRRSQGNERGVGEAAACDIFELSIQHLGHRDIDQHDYE